MTCISFLRRKKFLHYILDASDIESVKEREKAEFYSLRMNDVVSFAHITRNSAVESIKRNGLIYNANSENYLGDGIYCLIYNDSLNKEDLINFLFFLKDCNIEECSIVFGVFVGDFEYCYIGDFRHKGYSVLKDYVPTEKIKKVEKLAVYKDNFYSLSKYIEYNLENIYIDFEKEIIKELSWFFGDITEDFKKENDTWERIYEIPTQNKAVSIVVFSSVDLRTNPTREKGKDAVRIVLKWKTKNGDMYKRVAKHLRIETLFDNLKRSLKEAKSQIFKLNYKEFSKSKDI